MKPLQADWRMHRLLVSLALPLLALISIPVAAAAQQPRVLVFSKTTGFRHNSIPNGIAAIQKLGQENGFAVDATEDAAAFTWKNLARYSAVVFLSTTGDVLNPAQQDVFERYIQAGGGYVGVHSATDTEYDWPWYGRLAGAYFNGHPGNPNVRKGSYRVLDTTHVSTRGLRTRVVLAEKLDEPIELAELPDERVLFIERHGYVNLYKPSDARVRRIATIPVSTKYADSSQAEDGLLGLAADPNFAANGWLYMYYSPAGPDAKNVLGRFTMRGDSLDVSSKIVLLEIPTQRLACCHTGGSIAFDRSGNLYLSTGDNSNPFASGYAPIDERAGRMPWDAQKSSGNTNDLRGKIIRIHPESDGTYTIPAGNLFPPGTAKTRPEIYTMGHRNPYRISVDTHTGFLYW